jgi:hypothetical protein
VSEYADWWRQHAGGATAAGAGSSPGGLYLKDWHYVSEYRGIKVRACWRDCCCRCRTLSHLLADSLTRCALQHPAAC